MRTIATRTTATLATVAMGLAAVAGGATAAGAADEAEEESTVSISVEIDPVGTDPGTAPKSFYVEDVVVGDGPELTAEDVDSDPLGYCGEIEVDIDGDSGLLTVTNVGDDCPAETAGMALELSGDFVAGGSVLLADNLFEGETYLDHYVFDEVMYAEWETLDGPAFMNGSTVFGIVAADEFPFIDVDGDMVYDTYTEHWYPISAMGGEGLAFGWPTPDGPEYRPFENTTRDALAAFLYRAFGPDEFVAPEESPFVDVSSDPDSPHYSEHWEAIYWMAEQDFAEGWTTKDGDEFRPTANITRDAVATFLFRLDEDAYVPDEDPFIDVSRDEASDDYSEHAEEIAWMYDTGLSSGWDTAEGPEYRPTADITRDAVAVFVFGVYAASQQPGTPAEQ